MITYLKGDATQPQGEGVKYIAHICNDAGGWGAGFVLAISRKWKLPEERYRYWYQNRNRKSASPFFLGKIQMVGVGSNIVVVNMIAQHGYGEDGKPPIRYDALGSCLASLGHYIALPSRSVHMPRIGCGLAGGSWDKVEAIINEQLPDIPVFVYDL